MSDSKLDAADGPLPACVTALVVHASVRNM